MKTYEAIKEIRVLKSMNQQVIADLLGVDVAVVSNIEKGKRDLRISEIEKISNLFGMSLIDLIAYPDVYVKEGSKTAPLEATLQIKLSPAKREKVLSLILGRKNFELIEKEL